MVVTFPHEHDPRAAETPPFVDPRVPSLPDTYVPKHRNAPPKRLRAGARTAVLYSGAALFATGLAVSAGISANAEAPDGTTVTPSAGSARLSAADLADREAAVSRSTGDRRTSTDTLKVAELSSGNGVAVTRTETVDTTDPRALARSLMGRYGMSSADFTCLDSLWSSESGWNVHADNPSSSAYGIPQALPGSKMASAGPDWQDNAETQIRWGLGYIENRYGTACAAWSFKSARGWY